MWPVWVNPGVRFPDGRDKLDYLRFAPKQVGRNIFLFYFISFLIHLLAIYLLLFYLFVFLHL